MKIGLIDNDFVSRDNHNFPNLALMKLSAYHKSIGNDVELIGFNEINPNTLFGNDFDKILISKAFTDTNTPEYIFKMDNVSYGGTGFFFDKAEKLPFEIEHIKPDYTLYNKYLHLVTKSKFYTDYSIGFTTRGCFRHCPFCVNINSNKVELHSPIDEFYESSKPKLAMLDDNILGLPNKELYKIFDRLGEINKPFQYRQAMDIRLLTDERIKRIFELKYDGDYYFAFDMWKYRDIIEEKMKLWYESYLKYKSTKRTYHIGTRIYLFTGLDEENKYDEQFWLNDIEILFKRIEICFKYKLSPYIMRFETVDKSIFRKIYINLCQWTNHPSIPCLKSSFSEFIEDGSFQTKETKDFFMKHSQFKKYINLKITDALSF
jgi:hypothetical protein